MRVGVFLGVLIAAGAACRAAPAPVCVTVSAAVSLSDVLDAITVEYQKQGHGGAVVNVGGSDMLATQILAGAPVDLFISADEAQMDRVDRAGRIQRDTRVDLLSNQLAVVTRRDAAVTVVDDLLSDDIERIAMGDPSAVPAGVYARQYLEARGLWGVLQPKIVPTRSVRAALAAVQAGHAAAGVVYLTDAAVLPDVALAVVIPADEGPHIRYTAAVTSAARDQAAARRFLAFLRQPLAQQAFRAAGFVVLESR